VIKKLILAGLLVSSCVACSDVGEILGLNCEQHDHQTCCSDHGGVKTYDRWDCHAICADGTKSATCLW
jgi:hypothetical protein